MTKRIISSYHNEQYVPVVFKIYRVYTALNRKTGKPETRVVNGSIHHVTLYRDAKNGETVGDTIKRLEMMVNKKDGQRWQIETAIETDAEREKRREAQGLEVLAEAA